MATSTYFSVLVLLFVAILLEVAQPVDGEICFERGYYALSSNYIYCSTSCCGYTYNRYCCSYMTGGAIAGIVIGSLIGLGVLISIIVCMCSACNKSGTTRGRVVYPNTTGQATVAVINTTNHTNQGPAYPQHGGAYPSQTYPGQGGYPPSGQAYPPPPPAYMAQGPAYPPLPNDQGQSIPPPKYSAN
ncbi:cysteine and tyrosine-rich protein 1-like [Argopecten irradians]|uniref:cysteine and tyrosine-rich protein 1-like n=1 Tax=Argopecten irradians TaxID=31199 RepID=UPI003721CD7D